MQVFWKWNSDPGLLNAVRGLFRYNPPTDTRATGYLYSIDDGQHWPTPFAEKGSKLIDAIAETTGVKFTMAAFQAYKNGTGCNWHADTAFDAHAVLSLGVTRTFGVRATDGIPTWMRLEHGDLVLMPSGFQDSWEHCVPEEDAPGERVSLVFRTVNRGAK